MTKTTVLVTGAAGFVGSHLVRKLLIIGYKVYVLLREQKTISVLHGSHVLVGDICDWQFTDRIFAKNKFDICIHLASQALVDSGTKFPRETLINNITSTCNILEAARLYKTKRIVIASTAHVYGNNKNVPYKEYYVPRPSRIYETSKTAADIIAQSYSATYNLPVYLPRFTNIYGPGDLNFSRVVPRTFRSICLNNRPDLWGGNAVRDYLYIDDAVEAYCRLISTDMKKIQNRIFNFGGNNRVTVKELMQKIISISGKSYLAPRVIGEEREDEIREQYVSSSKANRILKWKPRISLDEGLAITLSWYNQYFQSA